MKVVRTGLAALLANWTIALLATRGAEGLMPRSAARTAGWFNHSTEPE